MNWIDYHSDSSLSSVCVDMLTRQIATHWRNQLPRLPDAPARVSWSHPSENHQINHLVWHKDAQARPRTGNLRPRICVYMTSEIYAKKSRLNCSNPLSVNTCLAILSKTLGGIVHISAPNSKDLPTD